MGKSLEDFAAFGKGELVNAFIETPKDCPGKYKYDPESGVFSLHRSLPRGMVFPHDYGFIPATLGEDEDPLDVIVLADPPVFPGCLVEARLIGVIEARQKAEGGVYRNDRFIAVHPESVTWMSVRELKELPKGLLDEVEEFFMSYHRLRGEKFTPLARRDARHALKLIRKGAEIFRKRRSGSAAKKEKSR